MIKGKNKLSIFIILLCIVSIQIAFVSGKGADDNALICNTTVDVINPRYCSPDIELQTSYISDTLEAGKTYEYRVQVKNIGKKDITIEPRLSAGYPIIYPLTDQVVSEKASSASATSNAQASKDTSKATSTPISISAQADSVAVSTMSTGTNGQAFDNDAVSISAPSTIKAGEVVNMTIEIVVPDNSTGNYYSAIDMNVNGVENIQYNPQLSLSFTVQKPLTVPYIKTFSTTTDAPVMIDISADIYSSDMGTRISPKIESPSFHLGLTCNGEPVNLSLVKTVESGGINSGSIYPTWVCTTESAYQSYSVHYSETYKSPGAVGDYKLSILPKDTNYFGYSITIGDDA